MMQTAASELAVDIHGWLAVAAPYDSIHECGPAPLRILQCRPAEALDLAKSELQNKPYRDVRVCWLRLYEESSLYCAANLLSSYSKTVAEGKPGADERRDIWMSEIVNMLDTALIVSGAPKRHDLFDRIFEELSRHEQPLNIPGMIADLDRQDPAPLRSTRLVPSARVPTLEAFQLHLDHNATPLLLTKVIEEWPAMHLWNLTSHLLHSTLNGRRLVPIEIGESYTSEEWRQELVPFRRYLQEYLLPETPAEIGYLGQHNLFAQIPQLAREIRTPDYCYSAPPEYIPESRTGLRSVAPVDEPQMNAWLGPKGTKTPLHTDPYHNIFCQVVGSKYIRLYPPKATASLYPRGVDENGINESNTSQVEICFSGDAAEHVKVEDPNMYPAFLKQADYLERIVGPGECLYIPAGWWHFVESLTTSFSVSFWWN